MCLASPVAVVRSATDLAGVTAAFGFVPCSPSFDVQRVDRPRHDVERIRLLRTPFGARFATTRAIQSAMSAETCVKRAARSGPSSSKKTLRAASLRPGPAHTR